MQNLVLGYKVLVTLCYPDKLVLILKSIKKKPLCCFLLLVFYKSWKKIVNQASHAIWTAVILIQLTLSAFAFFYGKLVSNPTVVLAFALLYRSQVKFVSRTVHCELFGNLISSLLVFTHFLKEYGGCREQKLNNSPLYIVLNFSGLPYCVLCTPLA